MSLYLQRKKLARKIMLSCFAGLAAFATMCFLVGFLFFVKNLPTEKQVPVLENTKFDGVIAYTGGQYRLGTTALIIKDGFKGPVFISGVFPGSNLKGTFKKLGLTDQQLQQINLDYTAVSTAGNVNQTINWVNSNNLSKVLIITSYYHVPRTQLLLNKGTNDKVKFIPYPVFSNNANIKLLFAEYIKFLLFRFNSIIKISLQGQLPY
ncbi:MAG TPA: hypothetical protein DCL21_02130 [Alphaproteobacteria bacterium]|nr:hypothetical protein [Alphaproteobacteria bacterium]